jgi:hypothetical protein
MLSACKVRITNMSILQIWKLWLREVKQPV